MTGFSANPSTLWPYRNGGALINRIKVAVLALFAVYWAVTVGILVVARPVFDQVAKLGGDQRPAEIGAELFLTALGTVRGWRWTFWLILIAFLASILRVPTAVLEIAGKAPIKARCGIRCLQLSLR